MKQLLLLIGLLALLTTAARSETYAEALEKFFKVDGADHNYALRDRLKFKRAELPAGILTILKTYEWKDAEEKFPPHFFGFTLDLNKDGENEYLIETMYASKGNTTYVLMADKKDGVWAKILEFQGSIIVIRSSSGWPKIVTIKKVGMGSYAKFYYEYTEAGYIQTLQELISSADVSDLSYSNK